MQVPKDKASIRKWVLEQRSKIPMSHRMHAETAIINHLNRLVVDLKPDAIFGYICHQGEVDITGWLMAQSKERVVGLPRINSDKTMNFWTWDGRQPLIPNRVGIPEPDSRRSTAIDTNDQRVLVVIPCVAIDHQGYRLGYGAGYYDRWLQKFPSVMTVGIVFDQFHIDEMPHESHDQKVQRAVTELGIKLN